MKTLPVSLAEISREGPWALRALGYSFYAADRATRMLVWTEAVHRIGLKFLHLADPDIRRAASGASRLDYMNQGGIRYVNAKGRCILDAGPPTMDLVTVDARKNGYGHAVIEDVSGLCMAEALSEIALNRDLGFMFVYASGGREIGHKMLSRAGWLAGVELDGVASLYGADLGESPNAHFQQLAERLFEADPAARDRFINDCASALERDSTGCGHMTIILFQTAALARENVDRAGSLPKVDYPERIVDAQRHGVVAEAADLKYLYELEYETWAPTSERSKNQAGF